MPARFAPALFGFALSGMMSLVASGLAAIRNAGLVDRVLSLWLGARRLSWLTAFPLVLIVAPMDRRLVSLVVKAPAARLG